jgi:hypothetical protein
MPVMRTFEMIIDTPCILKRAASQKTSCYRLNNAKKRW